MGKVRKGIGPSKDENPRKKFKKASPHGKKNARDGKQGKRASPGNSQSSPSGTEEKWSKSKKKRMRKIQSMANDKKK